MRVRVNHAVRSLEIVLFFCLLGIGLSEARAADTLRIAKSPPNLFAYVPIEVGLDQGLYKKHGIDIELIGFDGASKMTMGLTAGAVDITLGSPMAMSGMVKGMPAIAIAVIAGTIRELAVIVPADSTAQSLADLKGKSIGMATVGSITQWAALELARSQGWGPNGIKTVAIGAGMEAGISAMRTHLVDATVANVMLGVVLEKQKQGRRLAQVSDYSGDFIMHEMSATKSFARDKPDAIRRFLLAWYEAVDFMHANKAETVRIARTATGLTQEDEELEYDLVLPEMSRDGRHPAKDIERIARSFVELGILDKEPDMSTLYTEAFLPVK